MNRKEIAEIKRRLNPERTNATIIRGCYVNQDREIISQFAQSPLAMPEDEAEKYLSLFGKTLSGTPDKNLVSVGFSPEQVREGEEHRLLMALRDSALTDEEAVQSFCAHVIDTLDLEDNYLILLMHDAYDVPSYTTDGQKAEDGSDVFHYILCAVCPVRLSRPALCWSPEDNGFRPRQQDWIVAPPELGFMFPAFDDRAANIYSALCYLHDPAKPYDELSEALFNAQERPMPAMQQRETFQGILQDALEEECSYEVVQSVHEQLSEKIREQQADKEAEPLKVSRNEMRDMLRDSGVSPERVEAFTAQYDERLGAGVDLSPVNIVEPKQFSVKLPDVVIRIAPERADLIETRIIEGKKYLLIRAEEGVEVNGVTIAITDPEESPF